MSVECVGEMEYGYDADPYWQCLKCGYIERSSRPVGEDDTVWRTHERSNVVDIENAEREVIEAAKAYTKASDELGKALEINKILNNPTKAGVYWQAATDRQSELFAAVDRLIQMEGEEKNES